MKQTLKGKEREAMHVDHCYKIGDSHEDCQDYAISKVFDNGVAFICVADGCSSSHKRCRTVDVGARLLALASESVFRIVSEEASESGFTSIEGIKTAIDINEKNGMSISDAISEQIIGLARSNASFLLDDFTYSLDSTLIAAIADEKDALVFMFGDGIISYKTDEEVKRYEVSFSKNAPYYLSYLGNENRTNLYKDIGQSVTVENLDDIEDIREEKELDEIYKLTSFYIPNYKSVSIMSDGFSSFQHSDGERFDTLEAVTKATSFKNPVGEFVQRRINMMLKKLGRKDIGHFDDISIASVIKG